jgi:opacity protein-like surface antigen
MILVILLLVAPALAEEEKLDTEDLKGWGVRFGLSDDPDQVVVGAQYDFGEIFEDVHFEPNVELGIGDDHTILSGTAAVHYHFKEVDKIRPYAGGGVTLGFVDIDLPGGDDDSEFEVGLKAIAGMMWPLKNRRDFFAELNLGVGDLQEVQVMAGWRF